MTTSSETLGRRIARLRLARTATQERLAKELNVSPQAVSKWENDINYPDISLLPDLARFLGVSVDELLSGASASAQESVAAQESAADRERTTEVVSVADDEPAEIVEESTEQDNQGIATQSSGLALVSFLVRAWSKSRRTTRLMVARRRVSAWATALQNTACTCI